MTISDITLRAWWSHRQLLSMPDDGAKAALASPASVIEASGWARTVGSANPYVEVFSRSGIGREAVDSSVEALQLHELPAARGCTYVLPRKDFGLGLFLAQPAAQVPIKQLAGLGVEQAELSSIREGVVAALEASPEPLNPTQLRESLGGSVRSLGEAGKKKGLSTPLPSVLGVLQAEGVIRRESPSGRLDDQRYAYSLWDSNPIPADLDVPTAQRELADRFWRWTGAASPAHFKWFSSFAVKDIKAAIASLGLEPLEGTDLLIHPELTAEFAGFEAPSDPDPRLVTWLDSLMLLRRDPLSLIDDADSTRDVLKNPGGFQDLPTQVIVDRGRIVGVWEYDPEAARIVWAAFDTPGPRTASGKALHIAVDRMEAFVQSDLGDMQGSSMDTLKSRQPRLAAIRALKAG